MTDSDDGLNEKEIKDKKKNEKNIKDCQKIILNVRALFLGATMILFFLALISFDRVPCDWTLKVCDQYDDVDINGTPVIERLLEI